MLPPIATIDRSGWTQNKAATAKFQGSGVSFINSSVNVKTNVSAVACTSMNGAEYVCDGSTVVLANGTLLANTWYQLNESQVQLTYNADGVLLTRTSNGIEYIDGNKLAVEKIDTVAPTITSLFGTSTDNGYTTTKLKLTAVASDVGSGIKKYEFYKIAQQNSDEILLDSNETGNYTLSNPTEVYSYKVKVYDNVGLVSEKVLTESCNISTQGTCSNGSKTDIYTCTTGRKYSITTTSECTTTTTTSYTGYTGTTTRTTIRTTTKTTTCTCTNCNHCGTACDMYNSNDYSDKSSCIAKCMSDCCANNKVCG